MDNITHTLVGVALGHAFASRSCDRADTGGVAPIQKAQKAILWTAIIGSNLPDIDVAINPFLNNRHLAGLLQHRGYTHSFLALPLFAFIAAWVGARVSGSRVTRRLYWIGALAVFLHIAADYLNDYGVHPLSPFLNRWFYGDTLFILEPAIWLAILPLAFMKARSRVTRFVSLALEMLILGAIWFSPFAPRAVAVALSAWALVVFAAQWILRERHDLLPAGVGIAGVVLSFFMCGQRVSNEVEHAFSVGHSREQIAEIIRTPAPGDPMCWRVIALSSEGDHYTARLGVVNFANGILNSQTCFYGVSGPRNAALTDSTLPDTGRTHWVGQYSASLDELRRLARTDCQMEALLKFARAPYWTAGAAADLRYAFASGPSFTSVHLGADPSFCLGWIPPWIPPFKLL
jgi:inner membrane protein